MNHKLKGWDDCHSNIGHDELFNDFFVLRWWPPKLFISAFLKNKVLPDFPGDDSFFKSHIFFLSSSSFWILFNLREELFLSLDGMFDVELLLSSEDEREENS